MINLLCESTFVLFFYLLFRRLFETQDYGDDTEYILGEPLDKRIVGILGVSLKDGKQINVYNASDLYDLTIHNLSEYDNHLYFTCTGLDVPYNSLPDIEKNPNVYFEALEKHGYNRIYDYDIATGELRMILSLQGQVGFDFCEGYAVHLSKSDEAGELYDLTGKKVCELPFAVSRVVRSRNDLIVQFFKDGISTYYMYDFETNRIIRDTEVRSEEIYLLGIVGESCYGLQNGQLCYISADDFWNGRFSNAVFLTKNDYDS